MKTEHKKHKDKADAVHNNKDMDQLRAQREDAFACGSFGLMQVYLRSLMNWCSYNICHGDNTHGNGNVKLPKVGCIV